MSRTLIASLAVIAVAASTACGNRLGDSTPSPSAGIVSRDQAVTRVLNMKEVVRRVDRSAAKRMLVSELISVPDASSFSPDDLPPDRWVWVVAVSGNLVVTSVSKATPYTWGVFLIDDLSGEALASQYGSPDAWPKYFDGLPDH